MKVTTIGSLGCVSIFFFVDTTKAARPNAAIKIKILPILKSTVFKLSPTNSHTPAIAIPPANKSVTAILWRFISASTPGVKIINRLIKKAALDAVVCFKPYVSAK